MDERLLYEVENQKEEFFLTAIKNLIKKNNYLNLIIKQKEGTITQKEFDKEIKDNPKKYVIEQYNLKDPNNITFVIEIYRKLEKFFKETNNENIGIDEIAELFSINIKQFIDTVYMLKSNFLKQFKI